MIPHAAKQLSLCSTTTGPVALDPVLLIKRSHCNEKPLHHQRVGFRQLEKSLFSNEDSAQPKINKYIKKKKEERKKPPANSYV